MCKNFLKTLIFINFSIIFAQKINFDFVYTITFTINTKNIEMTFIKEKYIFLKQNLHFFCKFIKNMKLFTLDFYNLRSCLLYHIRRDTNTINIVYSIT